MKIYIFKKTAEDKVIKTLLGSEDITNVMDEIIEFAELKSFTDNILKEYLVSCLVDDENVLEKVISEQGEVGESLKKAAISDLEVFLNKIKDISYKPSGNISNYYTTYIQSVKEMVNSSSACELFELLCKHYKTQGTGEFGKYIAFLFDGSKLLPIKNPDNMTFESLIGLDHIKKVLDDNMRIFIDGKKANNVLLFGDRGTGKSSCVKALLNKYAKDGVRVIEMPKNCIGMIPSLLRQIEKKPQKFIIYLDDLSFEKHEPEYRSLKVAMDGQISPMPQNVIICATSNRRHLIKENWRDREGGDVHAGDNMQEMLSLSERFGISLVFSISNQKEYLNIVEKLLERKGIKMDEQIEKQAVVWQMNYGGRTPRCAAQFVDSYTKK